MNEHAETLKRKCAPCEGGVAPMSREETLRALERLPEWTLGEQAISRIFAFKNFHQTMAFVNAVAWIAHTQDHHPDLAVSYKTCKVTYSTHSVGGLSANDFICAAEVDALIT